jgi:hypothetical protein
MSINQYTFSLYMNDFDAERTMHPLMHDLFRSIGLVTSAGLSYYIWNNVYPIRKERLITDIIWQYHLAEAKVGWLLEKINSITTPLIRRIIPEPERKEVFLFKEGKEVASYTNMESLFLSDIEYPEHDLVIRTIIAEDGTTVTQIKNNASELNQEMKISPIHLLSATFEQDGNKYELDAVTGKKGITTGSQLFMPAHLKYCGVDVKDSSYTVSTVDNEVNIFTFTKNDTNKAAILTKKGLEVSVTSDNESSKKENNGGILGWFTSVRKEKND